VVGERTTVRIIDECRAGWLDESRDIFGVGNRRKYSRALVEGARSFFGSTVAEARRGTKRGSQKSNVPGWHCESVAARWWGGGLSVVRERERERGEGQREKGDRTICPHMLWPAYVTAASRKREREKPLVRNQEPTVRPDERKSETKPVTSPGIFEETSVFVIRKCSRKEN